MSLPVLTVLILTGLLPAPPPGALDGDSDGIARPADLCPSTPSGYAVNETGCALDIDRDGIPDGEDRCPATRPGTQELDDHGCSPRDLKKDPESHYLQRSSLA